ncbi:MAG: DUF4089 domain-containing protein [Pseudomonadota bacterium]|nr:DUF4089 domain-containing protein [Pseudomonadota bacterium]
MDGVKQDRARATIPRDADAAMRAAAALGLAIPAECLPGVIANLALLDHHADIFQGPAQ